MLGASSTSLLALHEEADAPPTFRGSNDTSTLVANAAPVTL
jgi:hypothetical protein